MINLFEQILAWKGYPFKEAKAELYRIKSLSKDELVHWQEKKKWEVVKHHYNYNPVYKKLIGNTLPDKWNDLPIVTKRDLQQPIEELLSKGFNVKKCHVGSTSGSTGTPFFYAKDKFAHAMTWAVIADRYGAYNIDFQSKQARFYGIPQEYAANKKEKLKDKMMNRTRFSVFDLSDKALAGFVEKFKKERFDYLYGYTSALVIFARYLIAQNVSLKELSPNIRLCICTSETCTDEDIKILERGLGVPVVREYGLSETCITAFDTKTNALQLTEETLYTEVVDSVIVSTSLYNKAFPMLRYATGDMGEMTDRNEQGYRSFKKLIGRTNDMIILADGKKAAGLSFYYIARAVLEQTSALKEFIVRQTATDSFVFDVVATRMLTKDEQVLLSDKTKEYLRANINVEINQVEKIERPASGKLKHFYSEISE